MYLSRILDVAALLEDKSFFLFGPRATGKSSLIKNNLKDTAIFIDLLNNKLYTQLNSKPWLLESMIDEGNRELSYVVIDEIQKVPALLDEVHRLIENRGIRFLLTGSSARKLRYGGVNLLAGRAWRADFFSLVYKEIPEFDLSRYLNYGGLPQVYLSKKPQEELKAYVGTYLKEEIQAEALVRKLQSFSRFLTVAALSSGSMLNFASLSNDVAIPASTVKEYYQILEDTLVGSMLPGWSKTVKRKAITKSKFYFFDIGVRNTLAEIDVIPKNTDEYDRAFEHFIFQELRAFLSYKRIFKKLSYWQAYNGQEVDFIIGDDIAIEVKATSNPTEKHLKGLKALQEENICKKYYLVCNTEYSENSGDIQIINYKKFLKELYTDKVI